MAARVLSFRVGLGWLTRVALAEQARALASLGEEGATGPAT